MGRADDGGEVNMEPRICAGGSPSPELVNGSVSDIESRDTELVCRVVESQPEPAGSCRAEPDGSTADPAVRGLVDGYERSQRPAHALGFYPDVGITSGGAPSVTGAATKTDDPDTRIDTELFTVSARFGAQNDVRAGLERLDFKAGPADGWHWSGTVEMASARVHAGIHNDDGTEGANLGAGATLVGGEVTLAHGPWSLTAGAAISYGAAFSSGESDVDGDGALERCFKGSVGVATLGFCTEFR